MKNLSKSSRLKSATISKLPEQLRELVAEHKQDEAEVKELWDDLPESEKNAYLREFGQNKKFFIDGVEVPTNFLDEVDDILATVVAEVLPEAARDWETEMPKVEMSDEQAKKHLEKRIKGFTTALNFADEQDAIYLKKRIKGFTTALKFL